MFGRSLLGAGAPARAARFVTASLAVAGFGTLGGCLTRPIAPLQPKTTSTVVDKLPSGAVDKIDLLFVVDNSSSMADKQKILALAVPDLLTGLLNPPCVDAMGNATTPPSATSTCPSGTQREFTPVLDVHIGVITSSLGSLGTNGCTANPTQNDQGHLISRSDATNPSASVATYESAGYLAWDPAQKLSPPGENSLTNLQTNLGSIITGAGEIGCGFESQNEAWYRFLVDPVPYLSENPDGSSALTWANNVLTFPKNADGSLKVDQTVLTQRKAFLRPDSLLAIINITDETDTSVIAQGSAPIISESGEDMPLARTECAADGPLDPCCMSCWQTPPETCPTESVCAPPDNTYTKNNDNYLLHAFGLESHKTRYGIEFFYSPSRYVTALTQMQVVGSDLKTYPNPLFNLPAGSPAGTVMRDPSMVFYAAITGVPWQLIARQTNGVPDLSAGFKSNKELMASDGKGSTYWDDVDGDPEKYVAPGSPFMVESTTARKGVDPITGINLGASTAAMPNAINGYERPTVASATAPAGDIEYACIFPILSDINCDAESDICDCHSVANGGAVDPSTNPLCAANASDPSSTPQTPLFTQQNMAKAYPGLKNLAIARGIGDQGIAASICAKTVAQADINSPEYGYRPAVSAIVERLKSAIGNQCIPLQLQPNPVTNQAACLVLEARDTQGAPCTCTGTARAPVPDSLNVAVDQAKQSEPATDNYCFCEVTQTTGTAEKSCQNDVITSNADGWCYVDAANGNAALVSSCPQSEQHEIRFVGAGAHAPGSITFITCEQDD